VIRLNLVVEGQTEEAFVRDVLAPHLASFGVWARARCAQTGRKRGIVYRGGITSYAKLRRDLALWMSEDQKPDAYFSTMVDLYRLPTDFPGYGAASRITDVQARVDALEKSFREDLAHPRGQFVPHIQPYEHEALLLARPDVFVYRFPGRDDAVAALCELVASCASPECINDEDPPSKRILSLLPDYDKRADGPPLAIEIGLPALRDRCPHFDQWLQHLEELSRTA